MLNIPSEFSVKVELPFKMFSVWFNHETLGLGNQLTASADRVPFEKVKVGAEKADVIKEGRKKSWINIAIKSEASLSTHITQNSTLVKIPSITKTRNTLIPSYSNVLQTMLLMNANKECLDKHTINLEEWVILPAVLSWMLTSPPPLEELMLHVYFPSSLRLTFLSSREALPVTTAWGKSWVLPLNCDAWFVRSGAPFW